MGISFWQTLSSLRTWACPYSFFTDENLIQGFSTVLVCGFSVTLVFLTSGWGTVPLAPRLWTMSCGSEVLTNLPFLSEAPEPIVALCSLSTLVWASLPSITCSAPSLCPHMRLVLGRSSEWLVLRICRPSPCSQHPVFTHERGFEKSLVSVSRGHGYCLAPDPPARPCTSLPPAWCGPTHLLLLPQHLWGLCLLAWLLPVGFGDREGIGNDLGSIKLQAAVLPWAKSPQCNLKHNHQQRRCI